MSPSLIELTQHPIPRRAALPKLPSYRTFPVNLNQPLSQEPLVDALAAGLAGHSIYAQTDGWNAPYRMPLSGATKGIWLRKTVVEKLLQVNALLKPLSLELYLLDGFRTIECQQAIYDWMKAQLQLQCPHDTEEELREKLRNFISDPSTFDPADSTTWTSHITGGAVDLTIRHASSKMWLEMGGVFDDPSDLSFADHYENRDLPFADSATFGEARQNRRLLHYAMRSQGFTWLPAEWWHFDFGDQIWSRNQRLLATGTEEFPVAFYGPCENPEG
ncbi:MAG: M15 family metallopeptidase [Candidatus Sumerlaeia bacterium]|nr:M15 family metallopeptidase [Candidatus Sumerlaeia bacterium]